MVARISNDYRPQLPAVGKDIPGPAAPCHVGIARVGRAVRRPYSDSEESVNDVWYADEHDTTVQQVGRRKGRLTQTANNSQLDDFKWFLPAEEWAGDLTSPKSEIEMSDSESEVEYIEPDSTPVQTETTGQQLLCPPVVAQTRPLEGCHTDLPRQLCRGRNVLTEDGAVAGDTRQVSAASDPVVSREIQRKSEYGLTIVPTLAAAPQTASEVVQPKPRDYCYMDAPPSVSECLDSPSMDTPDAASPEDFHRPI